MRQREPIEMDNSPSYRNFVRFLVRSGVTLFSWMLRPLEKHLWKRYGETGIRRYPPVFIVGAPRCGSTLLYKLLSERYHFGFISNFMTRFYRIPATGAWLQGVLRVSAPKGNYQFQYGMVDGPGAPSESGEFWYRWFPRGLHVYVGAHSTGQAALQAFRLQIGLLSYLTRASMLFKNLYNSMRIAPIMEAVPEACFLVCKREIAENAFSILKGRMKNQHSKSRWWSVPPKEIDRLKDLHYADQIAGQVYHIYSQIEEDRASFGPDRFLEISYEELCNDTHATLDRIAAFLEKRGCPLTRKWETPSGFQISKVMDIDAEDRELVTRAVEKFFGDCLPEETSKSGGISSGPERV